jgi:two-component system, LuxR family, sensor kinase FixL
MLKIDDCPGICAERVRQIDWGRSSLGPTNSWPHILRAIVATMLRSAAPKLVVWGGNLTTFYNDGIVQMLGHVGPEGIGTHLPDFCPPLSAHVSGFIDAALKGDAFGKSDFVLEPADGRGEPSYYQLYYSPIADDDGKPGGVLIDVYNATPTKRLEQSLRNENSWPHKIFVEAPVFMVYGSGPEFKVEFTNRAFNDLYHDRKMIGLPVSKAIPEAGKQGFAQILRRVFDTGEPFVGTNMKFVIDHEAENMQSLHYVYFIYQPVRSDDGIVMGVLCAGYDVTERHSAQVEAERLRHQVLHTSRINAMGTMAMTVAHELNQPLAAAANYLGAAQLLLEKCEGDPRPVLKNAEAELSRAGDVIRRIRSLVRSGRAERTAVSIQQAHDRAVMLLAAAGVNAVRSVLSLGDGATHVMADEVQLEQIFTNLLRNAAEAMSSSSCKEVHVSAVRLDDACVRLSIRDFGPGLPLEALDHMFEQLGASTGAGLGLGLALTRTLVEVNGGVISASNAADGGAVFTVDFEAA